MESENRVTQEIDISALAQPELELYKFYKSLKRDYCEKKIDEVRDKISQPFRDPALKEENIKCKLQVMLGKDLSKENVDRRSKWLLHNSKKLLNDFSEIYDPESKVQL